MTSVRVTILSPYVDQRGGAELSLVHALRQGAGCGVEWSLATPCDGEITELARSLGLATTTYGESRTRDPIGYVRSARAIRKLLKEQRSQLLLSWNAHPHFRALGATAGTGTPTAWFQKVGVTDSRLWRLHARLPTRAILVNSLYTAEAQKSLLDRAGVSRPLYVVPSAVEVDRFDAGALPPPHACREELGLPVDKSLVVLVGRLQAWKGFHVLVDALPTIRRRHPDAELVLVGGEHWGEPGYREQLERRAASLGLADAVRITGFVPHDQIARHMQAADVVVHASRHEPFGIVVIEAMALGKAVVAANEGGPPTVIRDGVDGLLADPTSPADLADKVSRALGDAPLRERLGASARERAQLYSVERFGRRLADAVRSIVTHEHRSGIVVDDELR